MKTLIIAFSLFPLVASFAQTELFDRLNWRYDAITGGYVSLAKNRATAQVLQTNIGGTYAKASPSSIVDLNIESIYNYLPLGDALYVVSDTAEKRGLSLDSIKDGKIVGSKILMQKHIPIKLTSIIPDLSSNLIVTIVEANNAISIFEIDRNTLEVKKSSIPFSLNDGETISSIEAQCIAKDFTLISITSMSLADSVSQMKIRTQVIALRPSQEPAKVIERNMIGGIAIGSEGADKKSLWFYAVNSANEPFLEIWSVDRRHNKASEIISLNLPVSPNSILCFKGLSALENGKYLFTLCGNINKIWLIEPNKASSGNVTELPSEKGLIIGLGSSKNSFNILQLTPEELSGSLKTVAGFLACRAVEIPE